MVNNVEYISIQDILETVILQNARSSQYIYFKIRCLLITFQNWQAAFKFCPHYFLFSMKIKIVVLKLYHPNSKYTPLTFYSDIRLTVCNVK